MARTKKKHYYKSKMAIVDDAATIVDANNNNNNSYTGKMSNATTKSARDGDDTDNAGDTTIYKSLTNKNNDKDNTNAEINAGNVTTNNTDDVTITCASNEDNTTAEAGGATYSTNNKDDVDMGEAG
jgi:hypothetical protein